MKRELLYLLKGPLVDNVANTETEYKGILFGRGFDGLTDMQVGPDGYLYILRITMELYLKLV
jgi:aldose sugar dehydrogenase